MADGVDLVAALDDLAGHLAWPVDSAAPSGPMSPTARAVAQLRAADARLPSASPGPRPPAGGRARRLLRRRMALVAAGIAAAVLVVSAVPSTRQAVADLLGVGGVSITQAGGSPPPEDGRLDLGQPVTLARAERLAPGPLPVPAGLGAPTAAFAGEPPGGVTLVWAPDDALPEVRSYDVGLLITAFPGRVDGSEDSIGKRTNAGGTVQPVQVNGDPAYWLGGEPHQISYLDEHGRPRQDTIRLSGNALVWEHDGVTYRLESALPLSAAIRMAESLPQQRS